MPAGMRAPFPWFGGKSRVAHLVWPAFGDVPNYVEPFAGSLAVLLGRPTPPRIETVNDLDCYLSNFWRCVAWPEEVEREKRRDLVAEEVARWADWPVNEADLHARHRWLVHDRGPEFRAAMRSDPHFHDAKVAGWWVWGLCQWIGSGWCWVADERGRDQTGNGKHPDLHRGHGVHALGGVTGKARGIGEPRPDLSGERGLRRRRDLSGAAGWQKRPVLAYHNRGLTKVGAGQIPDISGDGGAAGRGIHASGREQSIYDTMAALLARLRRVRVCCGDWTRILGPSATEKIGVTGVFLDPPYSAEAGRDPSLYAAEDLNVAHDVRKWALANGDNPKLRIALCGYEGEHEMPSSWQCVPWKANGGYAASAGNHENAHRERIWFSPHCLPLKGEAQRSLFEAAG
ncbi:MAG TPA: DNA adenine methylase [Gemmatimonadales bacterium]|nr:DNA adenine methylase [Gemmatimonadales bacterium]